MKDFITIIVVERKTILKGLLVSFLVIFPFTFLPIISDGLTWENIHKRFPDSLLYGFFFALTVVVIAVTHNYQNLVEKKSLFDKPAFTKLDFYGRLDGIGSIVQELETFLLGKIGHYYFRLNIIDPDQKKIKVEIIPLIDVEENKNLRTRLIKEYGFTQNLHFGLTINASQQDLQNENFLLEKLIAIESTLRDMDVTALNVDEKIFD